MSSLSPAEETTLQTYEKVADIWSNSYSPAGFWAEEMQRFHELLPSGIILEIGAGNGRDAKELLDLGYGYVGTDVSEKLLESARKKLPSQKFLKQSVYDVSFEDRKSVV
jgi:SAM-dependent methyltransferase